MKNQSTFYKLLPAMLAVLIFVSCSSGSSEDFAKRVIPATPQQLARIQNWLEKGFTVQQGYAVKSTSHQNVYYVAARLQGAGVDDFAAWCLSGNPSDSLGIVYSSDSVAAEFSKCPKGSDVQANAWITDPNCSQLLDYAKQKR